MSDDAVDDLHAAEEMADDLADALRALTVDYRDPDALGAAAALVRGWDQYCRPTCGAEGDPDAVECQSGDPSTCGCPCRHGMAEPDPLERDEVERVPDDVAAELLAPTPPPHRHFLRVRPDGLRCDCGFVARTAVLTGAAEVGARLAAEEQARQDEEAAALRRRWQALEAVRQDKAAARAEEERVAAERRRWDATLALGFRARHQDSPGTWLLQAALELVDHFTPDDDPCEDRNVYWPCDVAEAFGFVDDHPAAEPTYDPESGDRR